MVIQQKSTTTNTTVCCGPLLLSSGEILPEVQLTYERTGPIDAPVVLVCHALTGHAETVGTDEVPGWWNGLISKDGFIDTNEFQVITFNVLGGCNGSTGPLSIDPSTNEPYRNNFPKISIQDMVQAQKQALEVLGIEQVHTIIGGSLGGMQALEWGLMYPSFMDKLIVLAATPYLTDYGIAYNHIARTAITSDPNFNNGLYENMSDLKGFEIARMIGMVSYRSPELFAKRFERKQRKSLYEVSSYLNHQGEKLLHRFDANSYLRLLNAMDDHDIRRHGSRLEEIAQSFKSPILLISYDKDLIFEPELIESFANLIDKSTYLHVETDFGHDGFLTEYTKWGYQIADFIKY